MVLSRRKELQTLIGWNRLNSESAFASTCATKFYQKKLDARQKGDKKRKQVPSMVPLPHLFKLRWR